MTNGNLIDEIVRLFDESKTVMFYPHIRVDGDGLGSSIALCMAMRQRGKESYVVLEDEIPDNLTFLEDDYCTYDLEKARFADLSVAVDCSNEDRFPRRGEVFSKGKKSASIDHHVTSKYLMDCNLVDSTAAATGELVYDVLVQGGYNITSGIAEAIYVAITTDTGNFQYSNTTPKTHGIAKALMEAGADCHRISTFLYESERPEKFKLLSKFLSGLEQYYDGQLALALISQNMLEETGASMADAEGFVAILRSIQGVEVAVLVKEESKNKYKVSLRSKDWVDVSTIAAKYGGGGHVRAAGYSIEVLSEEAETGVAFDKVKAMVVDSIGRQICKA